MVVKVDEMVRTEQAPISASRVLAMFIDKNDGDLDESIQQFADFIGVFVHHDPTPGPPDGGRLYNKTKENYERVFGEKPNPEYWP